MDRDPLPGEVWSEELVESRFAEKLFEFETAVEHAIKRPMTQPQFDAFVCLAYNIGGHAFAGSSVAREFNAGHDEAAAQDFLMWHDHGNAAARRLEEMHIFQYGTVTP